MKKHTDETLLYLIREDRGLIVPFIVTADAEQMHNFIRSPKTREALPFKIHGKTYNERKASLRELAIEYQYMDAQDKDECLSMYEVASVAHFFETQGRKYGLLTEFRENAIC